MAAVGSSINAPPASRCVKRGSVRSDKCGGELVTPFLRFGESDWRGPAAVVLLVGALTIFRLWAAAHAGLAPDEAYYWLWSRNLAFGYADHPPMISWWIWLSTALLGDSPLGIRIFPVLSAVIISIAVYGIGEQLWSQSVALRAALWFNAMVLVGVGTILSTPDAPSTMFWALALWALSTIRRTERSWLWIVVGLLAGLGCVSKYTNLFFGLGVVTWLVVDPMNRHWLRSPWLWAGGLIACLAFLPVFLWNEQHDWVSFSHQFSRMSVHSATPRYLAEFFASQFGLLNPLIAYFALLAVIAAFRETDDRRSSRAVFLIAIASPMVAYMVFHAFHDRVQANWLAPIYPQLALLAASTKGEESSLLPTNRPLAHSVVPLGCAISTLALLYLVRPFDLKLPFGSPADRLDGWRDLAANVERLRQSSGASWIATGSYDVNAELSFYLWDRAPVRQITERQRYASVPADLDLVAQPALLVLSSANGEAGRFKRCFDEVEPMSLISRDGPEGPLDHLLVQSAVGAQPKIMTAGCSFHKKGPMAATSTKRGSSK
jgi:4-amino-4-deoxy-L-arabinose transferase-like glycosyltransferase